MWDVVIARLYRDGTWDTGTAKVRAPGNVAAARAVTGQIRDMFNGGRASAKLIHAFVFQVSAVVEHTHSTYRQTGETDPPTDVQGEAV